MSDPAKEQLDEAATESPVRESGLVEGVRGNQEVPPETTNSVQEDRLAAAEARAEEHLADLKRLAADFENYKKRTAREQAALSFRATERLVKELLPIVDDLERALGAAEQHEEAELEEGVRLVHRQLASVLEREGLAEIEADGKFDPHVHEALLSQPSEAEAGNVIEVLQKGYRLGDRVLRPARVVVAAPKEANGDDV
jgi:molecular chaperone GrpE